MSEHLKVQPGGDNIPQDAPGTPESRRDMIELWVGILTGPMLWFAQQQICFVIVPWVCDHGGVIWLHVVSVVCLLGTVASGWLALSHWRRERSRENPSAGEQRVRFMSTLGMFSSLFFGALIVAQGIPNFLLDPCQR
jgi:hypothetical protein